MFNLGYMHELGHGMPKDIHLAKRFYDMAAETSTDAKVPVALALAKLGMNFAINNWPYTLQLFKITISPETWAKLELYWDIYLLTVLIGLLGLVLLVRRPRVNRHRENIVVREPAIQVPADVPPQPTPQTETSGATAITETVGVNSTNDNKSKANSGDSAESDTNKEAKPP